MSATGNEFVKLSQFKSAMDSKQPDLTGVVKTGEIQAVSGITALSVGGDVIENLAVGTESAVSAVGADGFVSMNQSGSAAITNESISLNSSGNMFYVSLEDGLVLLSHGQASAGIVATDSGAGFTIGSKSVTSITDAIADSPAGKALVTDKAVADYIKSLVATDEEFDMYMGLS